MTDISRRTFLGRVAAGSGTLARIAGGGAGLSAVLAACESGSGATGPGNGGDPGDTRFPLRLASEMTPFNLTLTATPSQSDTGGGLIAPTWALNGQVPSPLLRVQRGERFRATMRNQLPQDLILHWHGLAPPQAMDGHPRFAVGTGGTYEYDFTVEDRAGTYWYHSHTHHFTGEQTYRGIAGLLLVEDTEEAALGLPSGPRELPLILQDRRVDANGLPVYEPVGPAMMAGVMGPVPFVNGVRRAFVEVDSALYRLRILNGSNARIFRLAMSDGRPLVLIGNDGGLVDQPHSLASVDLGPAERVDVLLDLRNLGEGTKVMLRSAPFSMPGGMGFMGGANLQGDPLDLLEFRVTRRVEDTTSIPVALPPVPGPGAGPPARERTFRFSSQQMAHRINGRMFEMGRIDEQVPLGDLEIWTFVNESGLPHPVHLHATHFRVLSRSGGRGQVFPWESGRKDTVLLHPFETVRVALRFTAHRGLFLLHCHNLEHEDHGMMMNFQVV
jgi:FtsP/CotA-like multicopper oxidase with cupredoxin domain